MKQAACAVHGVFVQNWMRGMGAEQYALADRNQL